MRSQSRRHLRVLVCGMSCLSGSSTPRGFDSSLVSDAKIKEYHEQPKGIKGERRSLTPCRAWPFLQPFEGASVLGGGSREPREGWHSACHPRQAGGIKSSVRLKPPKGPT